MPEVGAEPPDAEDVGEEGVAADGATKNERFAVVIDNETCERII